MLNKILLVEDDILFAQTLEDLLEESGFDVVHVSNGEEAIDATYTQKFSLYLLDINMPLLNGLELLGMLREAEDTTPAIFITSHASKQKLKEGFALGGDDYITKPFDSDELVLRIEAVLNRVYPSKDLSVSSFEIDEKSMQIFYRQKLLKLSKNEYRLLREFLYNIDKPITKEQMYEAVWENQEQGSDGAIRVYVNRLKHLLPEVVFENIRGIGYKLVS